MCSARSLHNNHGLRIDLNGNGSIHRIDLNALTVNLFLGNELDGGLANLWLRLRRNGVLYKLPLLGPQSPLRPRGSAPDPLLHEISGRWMSLDIRLQLRLATAQAAWFWHVLVNNTGDEACDLDVIHVQDIGLSNYQDIRTNEYYVSHYLDISPLADARHGVILAARQNLAVKQQNPLALMGSQRRACAYATDASQLRFGDDLPSQRLQHEHAVMALQDERQTLPANGSTQFGFWTYVQDHHAAASSATDLAMTATILSLPQAQATEPALGIAAGSAPRSLFVTSQIAQAHQLTEADLRGLFGGTRLHAERTQDGELLAFFGLRQNHIVLCAKEALVQRPHGHVLRSGGHLVPDEAALTSTVWMNGVFHSMLTQGHVSFNRFLSTVHGWLGLFRSQGQRIFVRTNTSENWQQLGLPSAFEIETDSCRWIYKFAQRVIEVRSSAEPNPKRMSLEVQVLKGDPALFLITHHIALGGDDGSQPLSPRTRADGAGVFIAPPHGSDLARRFPHGGFRILPMPGSAFARVSGDEVLFSDGQSRAQPFVCIDSGLTRHIGLRIEGVLINAVPVAPDEARLPQWCLPSQNAPTGASSLTKDVKADLGRLITSLPWLHHNALVHFLAPRGLEQYTGGGWGTRDVCQGPLEMLLALDKPQPVRDLLKRVFSAQNADGDWPQWFMFFERDRAVRAGDSHGDVVFWPLLGAARYLLATHDVAFLDEPVPFHDSHDAPSLWQHIERALSLIHTRQIPGTHLASYGHGDWNDSLQPADPSLRDTLCSAWTVTLHYQVLTTLAQALHGIGREALAKPLREQATMIKVDFQRLLIVDDVVTGYAQFPPNQAPQMILHPRDEQTGVRYSLLPMMHAVLENMLSHEQAQAHFKLIADHLSGPDGVRLFDKPLRYQGGPQHLFQRAESCAFFGREIGLMYTHAHLRYAQALAHAGQTQGFFEAMHKIHPLGLRTHVPSAAARQSNCYFSSSDAAFADRYEAQNHYERLLAGEIPVQGGWRVYSSGPGIAIGLVVGSLLGVRRSQSTLTIDPVMPTELSGLCVRVPLGPHTLTIEYLIGTNGCGTCGLQLNGSELSFTRGQNPYRIGAAEVAMPMLLERLLPGENHLRVLTY